MILTIIKVYIIVIGVIIGIYNGLTDGMPLFIIDHVKDLFVDSEYFIESILYIIFGIMILPSIMIAQVISFIIILIRRI